MWAVLSFNPFGAGQGLSTEMEKEKTESKK